MNVKKEIGGVIERKTIKNLNKRITKLLRGKVVLDDGGGNGSFDYTKHPDKNIYCIDIKKRDLEHLKNVKFKLAEATNLPFKKGFFDCVCFAGVIQYVKDPRQSLREIKRVLKKEGQLVVATVNRRSLLRRLKLIDPKPKSYAGEFQIYTFKDLVKLLDEEGFEVRFVSGEDFLTLPIYLCSNILIVAKPKSFP